MKVTTDADALSSITNLEKFSLKSLPRSNNLGNLFSAYQTVSTLPDSEVKFTLLDTVSSWIEATLLSDVGFIRMIRYWEMIRPRSESLIKERIQILCGIEPSQDLVQHVLKCLSGTSAKKGRGKGEQHQFYDALLEKCAEQTTRGELRCNCCGYHFRRKDLNEAQNKVVDRLGIVLAATVHPGRNEDPLKPLQSRTKFQEPLTKLTIDHVTPELRFGWTYPDNLAILCTFCNQAKLAYRRPLDAVSIFCAGALSDFWVDDPATRVRDMIMVAIIRANNSSCHICKNNWAEIELTVFRDVDDTIAFSPLAMKAICYDCFPSGR